jgi:hypothetical protein
MAILRIELLLLFRSERGFTKSNDNLVERAGKLEGHMVIFADRRAGTRFDQLSESSL